MASSRGRPDLMRTLTPTGVRPGSSRLAFIVCGTLVRDVQAISRVHGWDADFHGIPSLHHLHPDHIVRAVDEKLQELEGRYEKIIVVYGDCGTAGRLDDVLTRHGATRPTGPHCYEMLAGAGYQEFTTGRPGIFFLTPWLIRNFDAYVWRRLGLEEHPELVDEYFRHFTDVVYLRSVPDRVLDQRAREIADRLGLSLEIRDSGLGELERRLVALVES